MTLHRRPLVQMILAVMLCLAAACGGSDESGGEDAGGIDVHEFDTPSEIGTGLIDGMTPDGSAAYVEQTDPRFPEPGCEGQPEPVMFRLPLSPGEPTLVAGEDNPLRGNIVRGGSGDRIAVVAGCESFFTDLHIAREGRDGELTDVTEVTPQIPEGFLLGVPSLSWSADGSTLLAAIQDVDAPDGEPSRIVSIDPETGELTRLFDAEHGTGVFKVGQMEDGTYVVSTNLVVTFRDDSGMVLAGFQGKNFEIAPDRQSMVVFGRNLMRVEQGTTRATELVAEAAGREISSASYAPDGGAVVFTRYLLQGDHLEIALVTVSDGRFSSVVTGDQYGRAYFSGDGRALAFNLFGSEPDFTSRVYVTRFAEN